MGLLCIKNYRFDDTTFNVFCKLRDLITCIKDRKHLEEYDNNEEIISRFLHQIINDNNKHLFSDLYIMYIFFESVDFHLENKKTIWEKAQKIIEKGCSNDVYEAVYYYSAMIIFYSNHNVSWLSPNDSFFKTSHEENWEYILKELLRDDFNNRFLLNKFNSYCEKIEYDICKGDKQKFESLSTVLCIITAYCIVINDYNLFDSMADKLLEDSEIIHAKCELNNIKEVVNTNRFEGEHPNIGQYIEFILNMVKPNSLQKRIH